jgi:GTP-binding protein EngB required for normal cell division
MQPSTCTDYQNLVDSLLELLFVFAKQCKDKYPEVAEVTEEQAIKKLLGIKRQIHAKPFLAGFIGLGKVGKSTLLNALFGMEVAPRKNRPMTSAPVEYSYGRRFELCVEYSDTIRRSEEVCGTAEALLDSIEKYATEEGSRATNKITRVAARIPSDILSEGLIIADTPGFGAAQVGNVATSHESILVNFLPRIHQLFWVVNCRQSIGEREAAFYSKYLIKGSCVDIIVTRSDNITSAEKEAFIMFHEKKLNLRWMNYYFLSGKQAFQGKRDHDDEAVKRSGIEDFETRLRQMASPGTREGYLVKDILQFTKDYGFWLRGARERVKPRKIRWPENRWDAVVRHAQSIYLDSTVTLDREIINNLL